MTTTRQKESLLESRTTASNQSSGLIDIQNIFEASAAKAEASEPREITAALASMEGILPVAPRNSYVGLFLVLVATGFVVLGLVVAIVLVLNSRGPEVVENPNALATGAETDVPPQATEPEEPIEEPETAYPPSLNTDYLVAATVAGARLGNGIVATSETMATGEIPRGQVVLESNAPGATVRIDGLVAGQTDETGEFRTTLASGQHRLTIVLVGWGVASEGVLIGNNQETTLQLTLWPPRVEREDGIILERLSLEPPVYLTTRPLSLRQLEQCLANEVCASAVEGEYRTTEQSMACNLADGSSPADQPLNCISYIAATALCGHLEMRLPTDAEFDRLNVVESVWLWTSTLDPSDSSANRYVARAGPTDIERLDLLDESSRRARIRGTAFPKYVGARCVQEFGPL